MRAWLVAALVACTQSKSDEPPVDRAVDQAPRPVERPKPARPRPVSVREAFAHVGARGDAPEGYTARIATAEPPSIQLVGPGPLLQVSRLADEEVAASPDDPRWLEGDIRVLRTETFEGGWLAELSRGYPGGNVWAQIRAGPGEVLLCISIGDEEEGHDELALRFCRGLRPAR